MRSLTRWLLLAAISLILAACACELLVRAYVALGTPTGETVAHRDPMATLRVPHGEYGYRQRPGIVQHYVNGTQATSNAMGYRGPLVDLRKPEGTYRIVLLGGSATHGWGTNDDETIDAQMREILAHRFPDADFEVVNLALDGYDSAQVFERMRSDGVALQPDLVIVNSGVNDVRNAYFDDLGDPPDPRTSIWEGAMAWMREEQLNGVSVWTLAKHYSYAARLPGILRENYALREQRAAHAPEPASQPRTPSSGALDYFERSLAKTAALLEPDAALILSTPPSSLTTRYEPDGTSPRPYWLADAQTTQQYREQLALRMRDLAQRLAAEGRRVRYVSHDLDPELFIDDCHLTPAGNRALAARFVDDASGFFPVVDRGDAVGRR